MKSIIVMVIATIAEPNSEHGLIHKTKHIEDVTSVGIASALIVPRPTLIARSSNN